MDGAESKKAAANLLLVPRLYLRRYPQTIGGVTAAPRFLSLYMNRSLPMEQPDMNWHGLLPALGYRRRRQLAAREAAARTESKRIDGVAATITAMPGALFAQKHHALIQGLKSVG